MTKLSRTLLRKTIHLTGKEIDLLLTLVSLADDYGIIRSGYYRTDIYTYARISQSHFYRCLDRLVSSGIIYLSTQGHILLVGNSTRECIQKNGAGYINLPSLVFSQSFQMASPSAKKLTLHLLSTYAAKAFYKIKMSTLMDILKLNRPQKVLDVLIEMSSSNIIKYIAKEGITRSKVIKISLTQESTETDIKINKAAQSAVNTLLKAKNVDRKDLTPSAYTFLVKSYHHFKLKFAQYIDSLDEKYGSVVYALYSIRYAISL